MTFVACTLFVLLVIDVVCPGADAVLVFVAGIVVALRLELVLVPVAVVVVSVLVAAFATLLFAADATLDTACPAWGADVPEPPEPQALTVHAKIAAAASNAVSRPAALQAAPFTPWSFPIAVNALGETWPLTPSVDTASRFEITQSG